MEVTNLLNIHTLRKFIQYCHDGKMLPGWDDFGRLK